MDIGNQQRVIIVEPEPVEAPLPEPVPANAESVGADLLDEWPLPLVIDPDPTPVG